MTFNAQDLSPDQRAYWDAAIEFSASAEGAREQMNYPLTHAEAAEVQRLTLEKVQIHCRETISAGQMADMELFEFTDYASRTMSLNLETWLFGNTIHTERKAYRHPSSWWQAFKETVFPAWAKRRWPVQYTTVDLETRFIHVCPHLNIATHNEERFHLQWLTNPTL